MCSETKPENGESKPKVDQQKLRDKILAGIEVHDRKSPTLCGDVSRMKGKEIELKIGDKVSIKLEENEITLKVSNTQIVLTENTISLIADVIETAGKTNLGLDAKGQAGPNVLTIVGLPARRPSPK